MASGALVYPTIVPIPVDLFASKKHLDLNGDLGFVDCLENNVFKVNFDKSTKSSPKREGSWQGFKGGNNREKDLI
ncbi:unnamed protein product [Dovyalis caffra]|uniref:Uncharacterized protein n=1 Tax=Dovyalis caffra TaxID=77055 RepID=A0AAV1SUX5_9ROSI|nr:unnamed protein product [Dovyalis caffra]